MKIAYQSLRVATSAAVMFTFCSVAQSVQAAALTIAQEPLFLTEGVAPNLLVTLDDSGSMAYAYAPDGIGGTHASRRYKSAFYNPMYYNPAATYPPPKKVTFNSTTGQISVTEYSTSFTNAFLNGFKTNLGSVNLSNNFRPVRTYVSTNNYQTLANNPTVDYGSNDNNGVAAYYYVRDNTLNNCTATNLEDEDCYRRVLVSAAEQQNFANWYSFYRSRALATESAANLAFYTLPDNVRVTWQMLNSCTGIGSGNCSGASGTNYNNRLRNFAGQHRANFFDWLADTPASGGTPTRAAQQRAGNFLSNTTVNGPYAFNPGVQSAPLYACRPSYHILMTDGVWNENTNITVGNVDGTARSLPDGTAYAPRAPYRDGESRDYGNTLADLAFLYWAQDANTSIANELKPFIPYKNPDATTQYWDPRNNPATWQNMVTFTLGLGLTRTLTNPAWGGSTYTGDYQALLDGTIEWPLPASNQTQNVYELWHAALNSRGEFFSVDSPEDMVEAFKTILNRIADRETSASAVSLESAVTTAGNEAYYARFSSDNWSGELIKYLVDSNGQLSYQWNARDLLNTKAAGSRNILFNKDGNLTAFQWANLTTAQQTALNRTAAGVVDTLGSQRLNFIRGVRTGEGTTFRDRTHVLGDIVHSSPVVVATPDRMEGLMNPLVSSATGTYTQFKIDNLTRPKRIYVGANDGMLHGFDENGQEVFAYVPTSVIPQLNKLTDKGYRTSHQYYVDGTPVVGDVFIEGEWRTILIGTLRGGGREVFALDVTDPANVSLLWEFSSAQDEDLGFTFTRPVITRLHNGKWGVVLSNGYNSTNDRAALFVLDVANGDVMSKLVVNSGATVNGLSSPRTVDINGDLITDYVYAGDLQGNVWRFDMFTANQTPPFQRTDTMPDSNFRIAFSGSPLFVAQNAVGRQPITAAPSLIRHPNGFGYIVTVGTGKYIENSDSQADTSQPMSLYGIWDLQTDGKSTTGTPSLGRSNLVEQTMGTEITTTFNDTDASGNATSRSRDLRLLSRNPISWIDASGNVVKYGWYLDLKEGSTLKGEMVATDMTARSNVLLVATTTPNDDPCSSGIDRWFIALDGFTGGATNFNVLDMSGNNYVNALDSYNGNVVSSVRIPGFGAPAVVGQDAFFNTPNSVQKEVLDFGPASRGRQSWRVLGE